MFGFVRLVDTDATQTLGAMLTLQENWWRGVYEKPRFELGLPIGAIRFFAHDVQPWGAVQLDVAL
ncbi:MAG: hypothetical protein ACHREM_17135 [Polyangiales bacterium]